VKKDVESNFETRCEDALTFPNVKKDVESSCKFNCNFETRCEDLILSDTAKTDTFSISALPKNVALNVPNVDVKIKDGSPNNIQNLGLNIPISSDLEQISFSNNMQKMSKNVPMITNDLLSNSKQIYDDKRIQANPILPSVFESETTILENVPMITNDLLSNSKDIYDDKRIQANPILPSVFESESAILEVPIISNNLVSNSQQQCNDTPIQTTPIFPSAFETESTIFQCFWETHLNRKKESEIRLKNERFAEQNSTKESGPKRFEFEFNAMQKMPLEQNTVKESVAAQCQILVASKFVELEAEFKELTINLGMISNPIIQIDDENDTFQCQMKIAASQFALEFATINSELNLHVSPANSNRITPKDDVLTPRYGKCRKNRPVNGSNFSKCRKYTQLNGKMKFPCLSEVIHSPPSGSENIRSLSGPIIEINLDESTDCQMKSASSQFALEFTTINSELDLHVPSVNSNGSTPTLSNDDGLTLASSVSKCGKYTEVTGKMKFSSLLEIIHSTQSCSKNDINEPQSVIPEPSLKELISGSESDNNVESFLLEEYDSYHDIEMENIAITPLDDETPSVGSDGWVVL
jgi:hypothetical protein